MKIYRGERLNNPTCLGDFPICSGSKRVRRLGGDDYITIKFSSPSPIRFLRGDWIYDERFGGLFSILKNISQKWTASKGCYDYELKFEKDYKVWGGVKFMLAYEVVENNRQVLKRNEIQWKYTASLKTHLEMLLTNLHVCGFSFMGENSTTEYEFYIDWLKEEYYYNLNADGSKNGILTPNPYKINSYIKWDGSTVSKDCGYDTEAFYMEYNNISIQNALDELAKKFDAEWWVEGNVIHIGRCEKEHEQSLDDVFSAQEIRIGGVDNVVLNCSDISAQESTGSDATRFCFYGGTQNVPSSYGKHIYARVVDTRDIYSHYYSVKESSTPREIKVYTKWLKLQQIGDKKIDASWFNSFQNAKFRKNMYFSKYITSQSGADWFTTIGYESQGNVGLNPYRLRQDVNSFIELPDTEGSPFFTGLENDTPDVATLTFEHIGDFIHAEKLSTAGGRTEYSPEGTFNLGIRYISGESQIYSGVGLAGLKSAIVNFSHVTTEGKVSHLHYKYVPSNEEKTFIENGESIRIFGNFDALVETTNGKAMPIFQVCGKINLQDHTKPAAIQGIIFNGDFVDNEYDLTHYGAYRDVIGNDTWLCCRREFCPSQGESTAYKVCDINIGDTIEFNDGAWNTDEYGDFPAKDLVEYKVPLSYFSYPLGQQNFVYNFAEPRIRPYGFQYLDIEENLSNKQITEDVQIFDDVFPEMYDHTIKLLSPDNVLRGDSDIISKLLEVGKDNYDRNTKYEVKKELADGSPETVGIFPLISIVDTDSSFNFEASWMLDKADKLKIHFNSGLCMGMEFEAALTHDYVIYQNGKARELSADEKSNPPSGAVIVPIFQIAVNESYGTFVPNSTIYPKSGDKYTILGWDVAKMGETDMVENAERRLKYKAERFMALRKGAAGVTFTATLLNSFAKGIDNDAVVRSNLDAKESTLKNSAGDILMSQMNPMSTFKFWEIGDVVYLHHPAYVSGTPVSFQQLLKTRIIGYELNLDYPFDNAKFIIGTETELSRIKRLEKLL